MAANVIRLLCRLGVRVIAPATSSGELPKPKLRQLRPAIGETPQPAWIKFGSPTIEEHTIRSQSSCYYQSHNHIVPHVFTSVAPMTRSRPDLRTDNRIRSVSRHFAWTMSEVKDLISLVDARLLECLNQDDEHTIQHCIAQVILVPHALIFGCLGFSRVLLAFE
jgi:hypothetical protein